MARRGPAQKLGLRTAGTREAWQWLQLEQASPHHRPTPRDVLVLRQQLCWQFAKGCSSPSLGPRPGNLVVSGLDWELGGWGSRSAFLFGGL